MQKVLKSSSGEDGDLPASESSTTQIWECGVDMSLYEENKL